MISEENITFGISKYFQIGKKSIKYNDKIGKVDNIKSKSFS